MPFVTPTTAKISDNPQSTIAGENHPMLTAPDDVDDDDDVDNDDDFNAFTSSDRGSVLGTRAGSKENRSCSERSHSSASSILKSHCCSGYTMQVPFHP